MRHIPIEAPRLALGLVALGALLALGAAPEVGAEDVLARVEPQLRELVRPSLEMVFRAQSREELQRALAAERARLEQVAQDEPDTRMEATLVFARPLERDALLGLQSALGAELSSLIARTRSSNGVYTMGYELAGLSGDLAAKLASIEQRHRDGQPRRMLGARVLTASGASSPLLEADTADTADRERLRQAQQELRAAPLQFVEVRLTSTPRQLLRELERDPRILAVKLRSVSGPAVPLP